MTAVMLTGAGLDVAASLRLTCAPLVVCAWWWAPRQNRWVWLSAIEAGVFGTLYTFLGAQSLVLWANNRGAVAAVWIGAGCLVTLVNAAGRWYDASG
jgi:hypothetical protein